MLIHILKIIREQFRSNVWVLAELLVVFVVVWSSVDYFMAQYRLYHQPVGFDTRHVYEVTVSLRSRESPAFISYPAGSEEPVQNIRRIIDRIREHPDVENVALANYSLPYTHSNITFGVQKDTLRLWNVRKMNVSPEYFSVFGIEPENGGSSDELADRLLQSGEIISAQMAMKLFGRTNVVGEEIQPSNDTVPHRIIAVTEPLRNDEYDDRKPYALFRLLSLDEWAREGASEEDYADLQLVFRTKPNVPTANYAEQFLKEMRQQLKAGNYWVSEIRSYDEIRRNFLESSSNASGVQVMSSVVLFLLVNVFLALIGTFWFRVNRRREEIGLRMAMGSSRSGILAYLLTEGVLLMSLSALPALLICVNLLYVEALPGSAAEAPLLHFIGITAATWIILAFTILLAIAYPARKASGLNPAEALHYE